MGAIIFRENFTVKGQFSLWHFFSGVIVRGHFSSGVIILRVNYPEGKYLGGIHPGGNFPGVRFTRGQLS